MNKVLAALDNILQYQLFQTGVYKQLIDHEITKMRSYNWYRKVKEDKGAKAAEAELKQHIANNRFYEFATAVHPTILAVKALAESDTKNKTVFLVENFKENEIAYQLTSLNRNKAKMIVAINPRAEGCGCSDRPNGSEVWGENGELDMRAVAVCTDGDAIDGLTIDLICEPRRHRGPSIERDIVFLSSYHVLSFQLSGHVHGSGSHMRAYTESHLRYSIGLLKKEDFLQNGTDSGGGIDSRFFPGALDYFGKNIGLLPVYLTETAKRMVEHHKGNTNQ
jgi:hypothetical protein